MTHGAQNSRDKDARSGDCRIRSIDFPAGYAAVACAMMNGNGTINNSPRHSGPAGAGVHVFEVGAARFHLQAPAERDNGWTWEAKLSGTTPFLGWIPPTVPFFPPWPKKKVGSVRISFVPPVAGRNRIGRHETRGPRAITRARPGRHRQGRRCGAVLSRDGDGRRVTLAMKNGSGVWLGPHAASWTYHIEIYVEDRWRDT